MQPKEFHTRVDQERLVAAIKEAERRTTAKIYVYVSHRQVEEPLERAHRRFAQMGLGRWHHPHAVLIYLAPKTQKFAIVGDPAVHEQFGEKVWNSLADGLSADLKADDITEALVRAVKSLGQALAEHFPTGRS